ncbi:hypothetical protein JCM8115_004987 [Rhodotorula mucilaginosa]|uniref:RTA1 like protein-domain-containing protein n=1 Tax=Rhodotorula mucilaginosa TaxID=5537 RepID=A0A9P6W942_RHOMI|nr:hypothetical protein C6P46_000050 [Rhodotorula mucilaginosa]
MVGAGLVTADGNTNSAVTADGDRIVAGYLPEIWPAVIALLLYGCSAAIHWTAWWRSGRPRYMLVLTISMTTMTLGFIMRLVYRGGPSSLGLYIIMYMLLLLSPCAFLAMDYMILGRLAVAMGDEAANCLVLPAARIAKFFVWSDVVTFLVQAAGGGLSSGGTESMSKLGSRISIAGLAIQLASFVFFTVTLIIFGFRVYRRPAYSNVVSPFRKSDVGFWRRDVIVHDWRPLYWILLATTVGILVRSVFRLIEFSEGYYGYLAIHEGYFYLLDALPLWISMTMYCFFWPSRFITGARQTYSGAVGSNIGLQSRRSPFTPVSVQGSQDSQNSYDVEQADYKRYRPAKY